MARVLIVGCGELGSRHLQAVAALPEVTTIDVVDPRPEALERGRQRLAEAADRAPALAVRWLTTLPQDQCAAALCIVATRAEQRCALVQQVATQLGVRQFLIEKVVGQSVAEIEALSAFANERGLLIWVNCKARAYPFHQRAKQRFVAGEPISFSVIGGNHGLASNGLHLVDLFAFYDGCRHLENAGSVIDPILHRTKRGLYDLSGTLHAVSEHGSHLTLSYAADHEQSELIMVSNRRYRCLVDHVQRWAAESDEASGWAWRPVPFEGNLMVSNMTKTFVRDILASGRCELPRLEDALVAHRFVLSELRPHFSRLMEREVELCPVT